FCVWFDHFVRHIKSPENDPVLLILDGLYSYAQNIHMINQARVNHVIILCLPLRNSHKV
ncbi:hypothetical protein WH47_01687, partial [Habropoda laboriosa]